MSETVEKLPSIEEFNSRCARKILELPPDETVALVGAGLSQPHYPTWPELVGELRDHCSMGSHEDELSSDPMNLIDQLQEIRDVNEEKYFEHLIHRFEQEPSEIRPVVNLLIQLRFLSYVTTNFDKSLAVSASRSGVDYDWIYYPKSYAMGDINFGNICAIHGICHSELRGDPDSIVLHRSSYERAYNEGFKPLARFFYDLFCLHDCIFFGYGLGDPPIRYILRALQKEKHRAASLKRRMLIKATDRFKATSKEIGERMADEEDARDRALLDDLGIEVVRYAPLENHAGLDRVLESVIDRIRPTKKLKLSFVAEENLLDPTV